MKDVLSISLGEVALKGLNRKYFEDKLIKNVRRVTREYEIERIYKEQGKIYIEANKVDFPEIIEKVKNIFGIVYISPCVRTEKDMEVIKEASIDFIGNRLEEEPFETFKVSTNRSDKRFPFKSPEISREMGGVILSNFGNIGVDVHNPDIFLNIDIKEHAYIYIDKIKAHGGLPVGTNGKGLLLLSGGIDSPVAGFMMAKRGVEISCVHYHSYPFTSERAEEKVKNLAKILSTFTGKLKIHSVNILPIQKEINKNCPETEMTILSRRFMMRIAEKISMENEYNALITGENLGQVASQTIYGLNVTNSSTNMVVLRPLVGMDKVDIVDISKEIGTYETSILPFEDCCTVFLPKHPVTRPKVEDIEESEKVLDVEGLVNKAIEDMEVYSIGD